MNGGNVATEKSANQGSKKKKNGTTLGRESNIEKENGQRMVNVVRGSDEERNTNEENATE